MKTMKKAFASLLAFLLIFAMIPISAVAETESVSDTGWTPISSAQDFINIKNDNDGNYYLTQDIDFTGYNGADGAYVAECIVASFNGVLNGNNHTVKGFKIEKNSTSSTENFGLFQSLSNAMIFDLKIESAATEIISGSNINFGFLAGVSGNNGTFLENVHVSASADVAVTHTTNVNVRAGGLIGYGRNVSMENCSFTGVIHVSTSSESSSAPNLLGGMIGMVDNYYGSGTVNDYAVFKDCVVNADLIAERVGTSQSGELSVGGIIGFTQQYINLLDHCTTEQKSEAYAGQNVGYMIGSIQNSDIRTFLKDCSTTATLSGTNCDVIGNKGASAKAYYENCCGTSNPEREMGNFDGFDSNTDYIWVIKTKDQLQKIGQTEAGAYTIDGVATDYTYPLSGFYRLENSIEFTDAFTASDGAVINQNFAGIFDGNGKTVSFDIEVTATENAQNAGLFGTLNNAIIMDLNLGSAGDPITATADCEDFGIITRYANRAVVLGVNVYADITASRYGGYGNNRSLQVSGMIGRVNQGCYFENSNVYGSILVVGNRDYRTHVGAFAGIFSQTRLNVMKQCNNFADIEVSVVGVSSNTDRAFVGGLVGCSGATTFMNSCANFGKVSNGSTTKHSTDGVVSAGGLVGTIYSNMSTYGCVNFGEISSTGTTSGSAVCADEIVAFSNTKTVAVADFENYGTVTGTISPTLTVNTLNCKNVTNPIVMDTGAAVRLTEDTGLRFTATVNTDLIDRLATLSDDYAVSYGTLIAPHAFVSGSDGFTHEALDAFADENDFGAGEFAYIEVVKGEDWFRGEIGRLAGSITEIATELYDTAFDGVAYVAIEVSGVKVFTLYASNPQSRSIYEVAKKALDDTTTEETTIDGYVYDKPLANDETYYVDGTMQTVNGETVYSCYNKTQRDILNQIVSDYDALSNNAE